MAIGNFLASFFNDAFLGLEKETQSVALRTVGDGAVMQWHWRF